mmetsp:Transcript_7094/g.8059  ORF Transcript_7094/g.8059 Transcript_7094/m.8059 type:complete len:81 (+) Transcript_7094:225-467(+)
MLIKNKKTFKVKENEKKSTQILYKYGMLGMFQNSIAQRFLSQIKSAATPKTAEVKSPKRNDRNEKIVNHKLIENCSNELK